MKFWKPLAVVALAVFFSGCSMTVGATNPRPSVVVSGDSPHFALDVQRVKSDFDVERVHIKEFRTTLTNAFRNAVGSKYAEAKGSDAVVLSFESVEIELSNLGDIGKFLTLRFRGKWLTPDNEVIAEFAGVAQPRNPTETGPRHLEDVVEVMYEKAVGGLNEALRLAPPPRGKPAKGPTAQRASWL
jgi:hypothetical protein